MPSSCKAVILDRDGVINEDSPDYIKSVAEWHPIPGSLEAIARLNQAGYRVYLATNQSGIGRGLFDYDTLAAIHEHLQQLLTALGGRLDGIMFAPDHPDHAGPMRKPAPGMLLDLASRLGLALETVPFVGDSYRDIEAARAAGARPILVRSGNGRTTEQRDADRLADVPVYDNLAHFVSAFIADPALAMTPISTHLVSE